MDNVVLLNKTIIMEKKYFKFQCANIENLSAIAECKIRFSCLSFFNDIFEGYVEFRNVNNEPMDVYESYINDFDAKVRRRRFCCLASSDEPNYVGTCDLMWAHYANGHKGFCVEYNDKILNDFPKSNTGESNTSIEVDYMDKVPVPEIYVGENINDSLFHKIISKKNRQWEYEKEVRLVLRNENEYPINREAINAIYLGAKIDKLAERTLVGIAKKFEVPCFKMGLSDSYYELVKNPL